MNYELWSLGCSVGKRNKDRFLSILNLIIQEAIFLCQFTSKMNEKTREVGLGNSAIEGC